MAISDDLRLGLNFLLRRGGNPAKINYPSVTAFFLHEIRNVR